MKKLSPNMLRVLRLMRDGWTLTQELGWCPHECIRATSGHGYEHVRIGTARSLRTRGLIKDTRKSIWESSVYVITDAGRAAAGEEEA